jgi:hypothetical protein
MRREPFDSSVIRLADDDPAPCTRAGVCRTQRIDRDLDIPPAAWLAREDAAPAGACCSARIRHAAACPHLINLAQTKHQQAVSL